MSEPDDAGAGPATADDAAFAEVREAAGAVISSLKQLIEATERVVADPAAFASAVDGGRSIVEAFIGGFTAQADPDGDADAPDATERSVGGDERPPES